MTADAVFPISEPRSPAERFFEMAVLTLRGHMLYTSDSPSEEMFEGAFAALLLSAEQPVFAAAVALRQFVVAETAKKGLDLVMAAQLLAAFANAHRATVGLPELDASLWETLLSVPPGQ